jgi:hypothetical protein
MHAGAVEEYAQKLVSALYAFGTSLPAVLGIDVLDRDRLLATRPVFPQGFQLHREVAG